MSAAHWRKAMNFTDRGRSWSGGRATAAPQRAPARAGATTATSLAWLQSWRHIGGRHVVVLLAVLVYPWIVPPSSPIRSAARRWSWD